MAQEYRGWIPNVAGRLSYSAIGLTGYPSKCFGYNVKTTSGGRFLAQMQRRQLDDSVILPRLIAPYFRPDASFYFVFLAELKQNQEELTGHIAMMPKSSPRLQTAKTNVLKNDEISRQQLKEVVASETYSAKFVLDRDGYLNIQLKELPNAEFEAFGEENSKEDKLLALAAELYFFVRDITHHHNHHAQSSDRILDVVAYDPNNQSAITNHEDEWLTSSFTALRNRIIVMRRTKSEISSSPTGMLAYAESLQRIYARRKSIDPSHYPGRKCIDDANLNLIKQSIDASDRTHAEEGLELQRRVAWLAQLILPCIGVLLAWASLLQIINENETIQKFAELVNVSPILLEIIKSALEQPSKWAGLFVAIGILLLGFASRKMRRLISRLYYVVYHSTTKIDSQEKASLTIAALAVVFLLIASTTIFFILLK